MSFVLPVVLHEALHLSEKLSVASGFVVAYLGNMLLLRRFVYKSQNSWKHDVPRYVVINGAFRLIEYGSFVLLTDYTKITYISSLLIVLSFSAVIKFIAYRRLFKKSR